MVGVLGFSFSGQGQNAALAFVTLKDWNERTGPGQFGAGAGRPRLWRAEGHPRCLHLSAEPAADSRTGHGLGLHLPPAGPRRPGPRRAAGRTQPVAGHGLARARCSRRCAPTAWKTRRSCSSTSTATRPTRWAWASTRSTATISTALGSSLRQRLSQRRPPAARGGAGRRAGAHAARRRAAPERGQQQGPAGAAVGLRQHALDHRRRCRPCATTATRRCASAAARRRATAPARPWPRWSGWRRSCRRASASSGPASRARKSSPARRP